jgi:CRP-like cAMP-binding protein
MPLKIVPIRDRKLHRLVKKGDSLTLKRGAVLYEAGARESNLVLVRTGHLLLEAFEGGESSRVVSLVGPWEMGGEEALFQGTPRKTTARAGEASMVTILDGKGVRRALRTGAKTHEAFLLAKEEELSLARAFGTRRRKGNAGRRLGALILHLARRIGRTEEKKGMRIPIRLTHSTLADLSGCHRSTVTTLLNEWIYEGILRQTEGELRILKPSSIPG